MFQMFGEQGWWGREVVEGTKASNYRREEEEYARYIKEKKRKEKREEEVEVFLSSSASSRTLTSFPPYEDKS